MPRKRTPPRPRTSQPKRGPWQGWCFFPSGCTRAAGCREECFSSKHFRSREGKPEEDPRIILAALQEDYAPRRKP